MLTFKDLKEYDIRHLDIGKLIKTLQYRRDIFLNVIIIVLTLYFMQNIYKTQQVKAKSLVSKIATLEEKVKAITKFENSKTELSHLIKSFPQGLTETESIVAKINVFAIDRNIQISSFTPSGRSQHELFTKTPLKINLVANDFNDLGHFIEDIENAGANLRIDQWSATGLTKASIASQRRQSTANPEKPTISVTMEIVSVNVKE